MLRYKYGYVNFKQIVLNGDIHLEDCVSAFEGKQFIIVHKIKFSSGIMHTIEELWRGRTQSK